VRVKPGTQMAATAAGHARLRASRADRERVVDLLKAAFVQGRLTKDELEARVGQVFASRTYADLAAVTADIPVELVVAQPSARAPAAQARTRMPTNTVVGLVACVTLVINLGFLAAFLIGSGLALFLLVVFALVVMVGAIGAMIVASLKLN
jgi:Domain of unknown function (DUF1707)